MTGVDNEDGYTLIEALVAFTILAGALVMSFESFGVGLRNLAAVERRTAAIEMARHEIDRLAMEPALSAGTLKGETDGRRWQIVVVPIGTLPNGFEQQPFRITFLSANPNGQFEPVLETVLLATAQP